MASFLKSKNEKILFLILVGIIPFLLAISFFEKPVLNEKIEAIELTYIAWACDCANWVTEEDLNKYGDNIENALASQSIFIEPENQILELSDTLGYNNDLIRFTGQFYSKKGFPKGYKSFENPKKARIFRYSGYEILKSNYRDSHGLID